MRGGTMQVARGNTMTCAGSVKYRGKKKKKGGRKRERKECTAALLLGALCAPRAQLRGWFYATRTGQISMERTAEKKKKEERRKGRRRREWKRARVAGRTLAGRCQTSFCLSAPRRHEFLPERRRRGEKGERRSGEKSAVDRGAQRQLSRQSESLSTRSS